MCVVSLLERDSTLSGFMEAKDKKHLQQQLDQLFVGTYKLNVNMPKYDREQKGQLQIVHAHIPINLESKCKR